MMKNKPDFWKGRAVVVTGGAGTIGSHLVEELVSSGAVVTVIDNLEAGRMQNLAGVMNDIEFIRWDVTDLEMCLRIFKDKFAVFNLAAQATGVGYSSCNHALLLGRNLQIGSIVLEACRRARVPKTLVVSSSCVYSDDAPVPTPELSAFLGSPETANSGYGWAKRYQELQAEQYVRSFGMDINIVRPFNAYSPRDYGRGEQSHVIPALIERLFYSSPDLTVWGSGRQTRSFIHARDIAKGMLKVVENCPDCRPVNLGHDHETSMAELASMLVELSGTGKRIVFDLNKPEGALRKSADMTLFRKITGLEPEMDLKGGLLEMIENYRILQDFKSREGTIDMVGYEEVGEIWVSGKRVYRNPKLDKGE